MQIAPFAALGLLGLVASVLLPGPDDPTFGLMALGLTIFLIAFSVFAPWQHLPKWTRALAPLLYLVVVACLREATGAGMSGLGMLALLPVIWFALYGTRREMAVAVFLAGAVFLIPAAFFDPVKYPDQEWIKGVLWVVIAGAVGYTMQNLVSASRSQAKDLKASTELFASTLRAATEYSIIGTDARGLVTVFNSGAERMTGYTAEEMLGRSPLLIHDPDELRAHGANLGTAPNLEVLISKVGSDEHDTRQWTYRRKDGGRIPVELTVTATHDAGGKVNGFIGIASDISERLRIERELRDSHAALLEVSRLSKEIAKSPDARVAICEAAREVCGADLTVLMEVTDNRDLVMTASTGVELPSITVDLDGEVSGNGLAFESGERLFIADAIGHPAVSARVNNTLQVRSVLFEPVLRAGETVGVLTIGWRESLGKLSARSDMAATMLARDAGLTIESADLMDRLEGAALVDQLTGLPNRRAWDETLPGALASAAELDQPAAVAVFDIDHFKDYNDTHGHQAGDRVLIEVGAAWRQQTREFDLLARYGGEEFVLLMRDCRHGDAFDVVERIRKASPGSITCSAGFSSWRPGEGVETLVARADAALYEAKRRGRDATVAYSATTSMKPATTV